MSRVVLPELGGAEEAEDFFEALGVPFDPRVVASHRTPLLRLFGRAVAELDLAPRPGDEEALRALLRRALREAHDAVAAGVRVRTPPPAAALVQLRRPG